MDRERLKEVHQTDLTESNINEDFVEWLKTKGPSWLLTFLVCIIGFMVIQKFKTAKASYENQAWDAYQQCQRPGEFEDVAADYGKLKGLTRLAHLQAADQRLAIVQTGRELDAGIVTGGDEEENTPPPEPEPLTEERREQMLAMADQLYDQVIASDDGKHPTTVYVVSAMSGRAAVAESRGDLDQARDWYNRGLERLGELDNELRQQINNRLSSLEEDTQIASLPTEAQLQTLRADTPEVQKPVIDEPLRDLLINGPGS